MRRKKEVVEGAKERVKSAERERESDAFPYMVPCTDKGLLR